MAGPTSNARLPSTCAWPGRFASPFAHGRSERTVAKLIPAQQIRSKTFRVLSRVNIARRADACSLWPPRPPRRRCSVLRCKWLPRLLAVSRLGVRPRGLHCTRGALYWSRRPSSPPPSASPSPAVLALLPLRPPPLPSSPRAVASPAPVVVLRARRALGLRPARGARRARLRSGEWRGSLYSDGNAVFRVSAVSVTRDTEATAWYYYGDADVACVSHARTQRDERASSPTTPCCTAGR